MKFIKTIFILLTAILLSANIASADHKTCFIGQPPTEKLFEKAKNFCKDNENTITKLTHVFFYTSNLYYAATSCNT